MSCHRVGCHPYGLSSGWVVIRVGYHPGGLSSGWVAIRWVVIRVSCHLGGLSPDELSSGGLSPG